MAADYQARRMAIDAEATAAESGNGATRWYRTFKAGLLQRLIEFASGSLGREGS